MRGIKKLLLSLGLCVGAMGLCMGNATAVAEAKEDFLCTYAANPNKLCGGYGSNAVNTYTAEEAAAKGIPAGYENDVLEVISVGKNTSNGLLLDFSEEKVPLEVLDSLSFRVYISKAANNEGTNYPQLRIPDPAGSGSWVYQKNVPLSDGEWTTFSIAKTSSFISLCNEDGNLGLFELSMRSQGTVNFYIDSIAYVLKANDGQAPVINYTGSNVINLALGAAMDLGATATDALEGDMPIEYIWEGNVALNENGTPAQVGSYTLTLKSVDYFGNTATKTLTVNVTEADVKAPVIDFNLTEIKAKAGAQPMFKVTATDDSGSVDLSYAWSKGALDNRGKLTAGEHTWTITAVDPSGNKTTKAVKYVVTEEEPAYSYVIDESDILGSYTVTFDGQNPVVIPYGVKIAKPIDPVREETAEAKYKFLGWYVGDKAWDFENDVVTSDVDLQAKWQETKQVYRVSFNGKVSNTKIPYGELIPENIIPSAPTKEPTTMREYVFEGWYVGDKKWDFATDVVTGDVVLEAKFTTVVRSYTVTFDGKDAQEYEYGTKIEKPADPVKEATDKYTYEFLGWYNGDKEWNFEVDTVKWNTNLISKWKEIEINVSEPSDSTSSDSTQQGDGTSDTAQPGDGNAITNLLAGCTSVIGGVTSGLTALAAAAFVFTKKKED